MKRLLSPTVAASVPLLAVLLMSAAAASAQEVRVQDLTHQDQGVPTRLVGYGLVVGLDGTGDRAAGRSSGHTVQSVVNLLRRFDVEVPAEFLRTRNVAAVLVTAEVSSYLRPGGRFDIQISSMGDARSLRGGVLWLTPLVSEAGGRASATAQGPLVLSEGNATRRRFPAENTGRIPSGGLLETGLARAASFAADSRILLREPNLGTAVRIAAAINAEIGAGTATVEDPGSISLAAAGGNGTAELLARIGDIRVTPDRPHRLIVDGRDGTVVAGGDLTVGAAVVSHGAVTLSVEPGVDDPGTGGDIRVATGTSVQEIASVLHGIGSPPTEIAAIFESLREVGAISAEVVVR